LHQLAQALANRIHLRTRFARLITEQYRLADLNFATDEFLEIDPNGFDVRSHRAGRDGLQPKRCRVLRNLFAFDQSDLAAVRFSTGLLPPVKIAPIPGNSFVGDNVDQFDRRQGRAWFHRMHVQGSHAADGSDRRLFGFWSQMFPDYAFRRLARKQKSEERIAGKEAAF
jgi:hypothetical protein